MADELYWLQEEIPAEDVHSGLVTKEFFEKKAHFDLRRHLNDAYIKVEYTWMFDECNNWYALRAAATVEN